MLLFQDSLGKPVPEWQTILDFNATRDDGGGDAADGAELVQRSSHITTTRMPVHSAV